MSEAVGREGKGTRSPYGRAKTAPQFIPGWPYSFVAVLEPGATSWTAILNAVRLGPADDATAVAAAQLAGAGTVSLGSHGLSNHMITGAVPALLPAPEQDMTARHGSLSIFSVATYQVAAPVPLASSTCRGGSQLKASVMQSTRQSAASKRWRRAAAASSRSTKRYP
jgi:hypothetical protein